MRTEDVAQAIRYTALKLGIEDTSELHSYEIGCEYVSPFVYRKKKCRGCKLERKLRLEKILLDRMLR